jgi:hypothetical protein
MIASFCPTFICVKDCFLCPELCYKYSCTDILIQFLKGLNITADQKKVIRKACYSFYESAAELLQSEHSVSISVFANIIYYWLSSPSLLWFLFSIKYVPMVLFVLVISDVFNFLTVTSINGA